MGIATTLPTGRLEVGTTRLGVPGLFVSDGANVGIATTAPVSRLDIKSSGSQKDQFTITKSDADTPIFKVREFSGGQGAMYLYNGPDFTTLLNASGDSYFAGGNLGIGTTMPTGRLVVAGATAGKPSLFVTETGNVGIGTTDPGTYSLYVAGDTYIGGVTVTGGQLNFGGDLNMQGHKVNNASNIGIGISSAGNAALIVMGGNVGIGTSTPGDSALAVMGGNVGIGTTAPGAPLEVGVNAATDILKLSRTGQGNAAFLIGGTGYPLKMYTSSDKDIQISPAGGDVMRLTSAGNVGIGTTGPGARLEIGTTNLSRPALFVDSTGGQVGIGTTAPGAKLEITGAASGITTYLTLNPRSASSNVGAAIDFRVSDDQTANRYLARIAGVRSPSADGASDL
ncbi:MAG: hypothetical protein Q8O57_14125, partial [Kiritimatiellota bacterium]|nr:hypothetical protein [Kiritimatiellota bacterium]